MEVLPEIVAQKNKWLVNQVEVKFPTSESLKGRDLYLEYEKQSEYQKINTEHTEALESIVDELYLVDFHRLTIMFSILQASRWNNAEDRAYVLEFFSQIILNNTCQLYVGFVGTIPVCSAIVTQTESDALISDVVVDGSSLKSGETKALFLNIESVTKRYEAQLICHLNLLQGNKPIWIQTILK